MLAKELFSKMLATGTMRPSVCLNFIKRSLLVTNQLDFEEGLIHEDELFTPQLYALAHTMVYVPRMFFHRRVRLESIMTSVKKEKTSLKNKNIIPWHIDVQYVNSRYEMLVFDVDSQSIDWFSSDDGINFVYLKHILCPSHKKWDFYEQGLYRACLVKIKNDYLIYFSAHNNNDSSIGIMRVNKNLEIKILSGENLVKTIIWNIYVQYKRTRKWGKEILCQQR